MVVRCRVSWANWFALRLAHWVVDKDKHVALLTFSMELASESELARSPLATSHECITLEERALLQAQSKQPCTRTNADAPGCISHKLFSMHMQTH